MTRMINVFTTFSGYDSQMLALRRLTDYSNNALQFDLVGWSEIDDHAIRAHDILFPEYADRNFGDICKIDWDMAPEFDLLTYSSPCQDFSIAGLQKGGAKGSGTRSSLLWEIEHAIEHRHPKYMLMENVDALTSEKFRPLLVSWLNKLSSYGYTNHVKVLNAKNYGVPQNRNRVFVLSILGNEFNSYYWPEPMMLTRRLRDVLEKDVDNSYFLTEKQIGYFLAKNDKPNNHYNFVTKTVEDDVANAVTHSIGWGNPSDNHIVIGGGQPQINRLGTYQPGQRKCSSVVAGSDGIAPTCTLCHGSVTATNIEVEVVGHYGPKKHCSALVTSDRGASPTVTENHGSVTATFDHMNRIRKLTPREFYRLMDVDDKDIDKLLDGMKGKTAHYKLAGNSIVVAVLFHIFRKLFWETENENPQLTLF